MIRKVLNIDGKEVAFSCSASMTMKYRSMFNRDMIIDMKAMQKKKRDDVSAEDLETMYNIAYCMAKQADPSIPDSPMDWLDTFETFPIMEIFPAVSEMYLSSLGVIATPAKKK